MERKIGEIFEYNGAWYQCIKAYDKCSHCDFAVNYYTCGIIDAWCSGPYRKDRKNVIFRKLKKIGEPYTDYCPIGKIIHFQRYKCYQKPIYTGDLIYCPDDSFISIEIKNKEEDMKTVRISKDDLNFLVNKIRYGILPKHTDCDEIIAEITDLFSVDDTKHFNTENIEKNLKPFDLEAAKAGKPVCTRDGRKARIICFNKITCKNYEELKIVALIREKDEENIHVYNNEGKKYHEDSPIDLMMLPEKKEGWVNIYKNTHTNIFHTGAMIYESQQEALDKIDFKNYITTVKIEWEE